MAEYKPTPITVNRHYPPAPLVGVGVAVFNKKGEVLLVRRGHPPNAGQWGLPGGLLNLGERLAEAARREVWEECAVEIEIGALISTYELIEWDEEERVTYHYVVLDFWARYVAGEATAQDDAAALAWFSIDALITTPFSHELRSVIQSGYQAWLQHSTV